MVNSQRLSLVQLPTYVFTGFGLNHEDSNWARHDVHEELDSNAEIAGIAQCDPVRHDSRCLGASVCRETCEERASMSSAKQTLPTPKKS
jgi:hypothetical protein